MRRCIGVGDGVCDTVGKGVGDDVGNSVGDGIGLQWIAPLGFCTKYYSTIAIKLVLHCVMHVYRYWP